MVMDPTFPNDCLKKLDAVIAKISAGYALEEREPIIDRDSLIFIDELEGRSFIEKEILPRAFDAFRTHVRVHGWFYPPFENSLTSVLSDLENVSRWTSQNSSSLWLKAFVKSFWDVDNGPSKSFWDDVALERVLRYRLSLNDSRPYEYTLRDGRTVSTRETFDISLCNVRRGFIVQRRAVSWFKPSHAAWIYKQFVNDLCAPVVWDPSIGFSARLLGFAGGVGRGTYIGTDPAEHMINDARRLADVLASHRPDVRVELHKVGSEAFCPDRESLDLAFTSPPYFDREKYFDEPGQCWRDYPTIDEWTNGYLLPTLSMIRLGLKHRGQCIINVYAALAPAVAKAASSLGFALDENRSMLIPLRSDHFRRKHGHDELRNEPVMVFNKT